MTIKLSLEKSIESLGKSLENFSIQAENEINSNIKDLAYSAYANIIAKARKELNSTGGDFLKGLSIQDAGNNSFVISLEGDWPNAIEAGYGAYDLAQTLLNSTKTTASGEPWVKTSQEGNKYAHVPLRRKPYSAGGGDLANSLKSMKATNTQGRKQRITSIFKDLEGVPLQGKVAVARSDNPLLDNLTKYQKTYVNDLGKTATQSIYLNFRTISSAGKPWIHPGWRGLHSFDEAEKMLQDGLDKLVREWEK